MTTGIGNEWDPGDPPEVNLGYSRRKTMAKGSRLGRMVEFFNSGDIEECRFVLSRATDIMVKRNGGGRTASAPVKTRKPRRTKAQIAAETVTHTTHPDAHDLSVGA